MSNEFYNKLVDLISNEDNFLNHKVLVKADLGLYQWILEQNPEIESLDEKIYFVLNGKPECSYGNTRKFLKYQNKYGYCGRADICKCCKDKSAKTVDKMRAKTTVEWDAITIKRKASYKKHYGCENPSSSQEVKDKKKATLQKNWNVDNPMDSKELRAKRDATNLETYGNTNPAKTATVKKKARETNKKRYGDEYYSVRSHIPQEIRERLDNIDWLIEENKTKTPLQIAAEIGVSATAIYKKFGTFGIDYVRHPNNSIPEDEIIDYIKSLLPDIDIQQSNRTLCKPKEIDIYIPSLNLAIEHDGLYSHCEIKWGKGNRYHINKTNKCAESNVRLIHIFGNEWLEKRDIIKSRLKSILKLNDKIPARKTIIKLVNEIDERMFLNMNHIQGYARSDICIGLYLNENLVSLMSFCKDRFGRKHDSELLRYVSLCGINVIGGASKLFSYYVKNYKPESVVTYSDKRWNTGLLYEKLGFKFSHSSNPNYFYTKDYHRLFSRHSFQKHRLKNVLPMFDPLLSEWQNMQNNGYDRIWDCGNDVWIWNH